MRDSVQRKSVQVTPINVSFQCVPVQCSCATLPPSEGGVASAEQVLFEITVAEGEPARRTGGERILEMLWKPQMP